MNEMNGFFQRLNKLNNGERAALKRSAGVPLDKADGKAIAAFYRCLPAESKAEDRWFAVACLRCLWDAGEEQGDRLERVISRMIRADELSESIQHRIEILLDTPWDSDGYMLGKLTRMVKLIRQKANRTPIDFSALLEDLIYWNSEKQYVQKKWARAVFTSLPEE